MKRFIYSVYNSFRQKPVTFLIYLIIFSIALVEIINYYTDKIAVSNDYLVTKGWIIEYKEFGIGPNIYVTYEYKVENKNFKREIDGPNKRYDKCKENILLFKKKRFKVIYSKRDPSKSLIDLTVEVQDSGKVTIPKTLKNFE